MIKFSRNIKYQSVRSPPNTQPMVMYMYIYGYFATGYYYIRTYRSKQFSVGLMLLSDGLVYFLKIEKNFCRIYHNYIVALIEIISSFQQIILSTILQNVTHWQIMHSSADHSGYSVTGSIYVVEYLNAEIKFNMGEGRGRAWGRVGGVHWGGDSLHNLPENIQVIGRYSRRVTNFSEWLTLEF